MAVANNKSSDGTGVDLASLGSGASADRSLCSDEAVGSVAVAVLARGAGATVASSSPDELSETFGPNIYNLLSRLAEARRGRSEPLTEDDVVEIIGDGEPFDYLLQELPRCSPSGRDRTHNHCVFSSHLRVFRELKELFKMS